MVGARRKVPAALAVAAVFGLSACGGEAESAGDEESLRVIPPAEQTEPAAEVEPSEAPASPEDAPAATEAAPGDPAPAPSVSRAEGEAAPVRPARATRSRRELEEATTPPTRPRDVASRGDLLEDRTDEVAEPRPAPEPPPPTVPLGTRVDLRVESRLSTADHREGDVFFATVIDDVLAPDGMVLIPSGARMRGRVLESRESPDSEVPAVLVLGVESFEIYGRTRPVRATVTDVEMTAERKDSDGRTAAKVGAGAVAGAVLGKILGKENEDALKGAVAGAAAGGAVAVATRSGHAVIEEGARLVIRLDRALVVD